MTKSCTEDVQQLIASMGDFELPLDRTSYEMPTEYHAISQELTRLEGLFVVLNNLPPTDPDLNNILGEAKSLHFSIKMKLVSKNRFDRAG